MTPERWKQIEELYHSTYAQPPAERTAFLARACAEDESLRHEVESLLAESVADDGFHARSTLTIVHPLSIGASEPMTDRVIGGYHLQTLLGAGGMGEVYRAHDPSLGRDVAIKFLPQTFTNDPDRLARFEREARMLAALNHPNICAIYGLEEAEGIRFLVLELVEGETLAARLGAPLGVREVLTIGRQIAEALEVAHEKGIVHRDLKPANITITRDGVVKVLDFGLAKPVAAAVGSPDLTQGPDADGGEGRRGGIVGTAAYMSPEQARGLPIDKRTDVWSFGVVLFEMVSGQRPFIGDTVTDTLASVLKTDPDWSALPATVTPVLQRLLRRCLEKDPKRRLQAIGDARVEIDELLNGSPEESARPLGRPRLAHPLIAWAIAATAVGVAAIAGATFVRRPAVPAIYFPALPPPGASLATEEAPVISPDGRRLAFVGYDASGRQLLYTSVPGAPEPARPLANTGGASLPFWSPDSVAIGFFGQGMLRTVDIATGGIRTLAEAEAPRGGTWNQDGVVVYVPRPLDGAYRISATDSGAATPVPFEGERSPGGWFPSFLPDGKHFLEFVPTVTQPENSAVWAVALDSGKRTRLVASRSNAVYAEPGYLLFWREGTLWAQSFDKDALAMRGNPMAVASAVGLNPVTNQALFSASSSGTLVYFSGAVGRSELVWIDRSGTAMGKPGPNGVMLTVSLSPDASSVVYDQADARTASFDLWQLTFARGVPEKLTFNPAHDLFPVWSDDGSRIAFSSLRERPPPLYELSANNAGNEKLLVRTKFPAVASAWSGDGQMLFYTVTNPKTRGDIWALPSGKEPIPIANTPADERYGTLSPDGRWLAYVSNESGTYEVNVRGLSAAGVRRQVSINGGSQPQWRRDGRELFFLGSDRALMALDFQSSAATFVAGAPAKLFPTRTKSIEIQATARSYAAAPDGKRFLVANATEESQSASITVVLNWLAALNGRDSSSR